MMLQEVMLLETLSAEAINKDLVTLCMYGDLRSIKKMFLTPSIKEKIDFNYQDGTPLRQACHYGHLEVVKFLLNDCALINDCIYDAIDQALINACFQNHIEVVKYLLTSPDLKKHADIYAEECKAFVTTYLEDRKEIIEYLIFDYDITLNETIENLIQSEPKIKKMFEVRQLNKKMNNFLKNKSQHIPKGKI